jgi:MATE family multidrug resistance protein
METQISQNKYPPGGCAEVLNLSLPLIISIGIGTIQMFIDRIFLTWFSADAMAGAMQGGITNFAIASLFLGTVSYVNTFVAQYTGAARHHRVGSAIWQGIYLAALSGLLMLMLALASGLLFRWVGHQPAVRQAEITYFRIMCIGAMPMLISSVLASFFTGRGDTKTAMLVSLASTVVNIVLDYLLIFGKFGFPRWGVAGAAWATVVSYVFSMAVYFALFARAEYRNVYGTLQNFRPDFDLIARILKFGLPNGLQFMLDVFAFAVFLVFVGRISTTALTATSIAFNINTLAFMPMLGIGTGVSILVGQALGKGQPALAQRSTWSGFYLTYAYMTILALGYWLLPQLFIFPFSIGADPAQFAEISPIIKNLLLFVAFYCLFDTGNIIFSAALKGAGDTRFVMFMTIILSWLVMVIPSWISIHYGLSVYVVWTFATAYVCILAIVFLLRFLAGHWKDMRVIEAVPPQPLPKLSGCLQ